MDQATDYLIVGAGASGLAFADSLLTESDANIVLVDRRAEVGGHWGDAYPFVQLHTPSSYYGVNSIPLGEDRIQASDAMPVSTSRHWALKFMGISRRCF